MKYLKNVIEIEKHIAVSNGTLRNYSKTLENLLQNWFYYLYKHGLWTSVFFPSLSKGMPAHLYNFYFEL